MFEDLEKEDIINNILRKFSSSELENLLKHSSRNTALEVVKCLIEGDTGLLTEMLTIGIRAEIDKQLDSPNFEETDYEKQVFTTQYNKDTLRDKFFNKLHIRRLVGKEAI